MGSGMAGRLNNKLNEATTSYNNLKTSTGMSYKNSSISGLYQAAQSQVQETTDSVDRLAGNSTTSTKGSKLAMALSIAAATLPLATTVFAMIKNSNASKASAGTAGSGDPVKDIDNAIAAHKQAPTKATMSTLTSAIASANTRIATLTQEQATYNGLIDKLNKQNDASYEAEANKQKEVIKENTDKINESNEAIKAYSNVEDALKGKYEDLNVKQQTVSDNVAKGQEAKDTAEKTASDAKKAQEDASNGVLQFEEKNAGDVKTYNECLGKQDSLKQATGDAQKALDTNTNTIKGYEAQIAGIESTIKSHESATKAAKKNGTAAPDASVLTNAKNEKTKVEAKMKEEKAKTSELKDNLSKAKKEEEDNNKQISKLEQTITCNGQTLTKLKSRAEAAQATKVEAEAKVETAATELKTYLVAKDETTQAVADNKDQTKEVQAKKELTNEQVIAWANEQKTAEAKSVELEKGFAKAKEKTQKAKAELQAKINTNKAEVTNLQAAIKRGNSALNLDALNPVMSMSELEQSTPKTVDIKINGKTEHCEEVTKGQYKVIGSKDGKVYDKNGNLLSEEKKDDKKPATQTPTSTATTASPAPATKSDAPKEIKHGSAEEGTHYNGDLYTDANRKMYTFKDGYWVSNDDGTKKYKNFDEIKNASKTK